MAVDKVFHHGVLSKVALLQDRLLCLALEQVALFMIKLPKATRKFNFSTGIDQNNCLNSGLKSAFLDERIVEHWEKLFLWVRQPTSNLENLAN